MDFLNKAVSEAKAVAEKIDTPAAAAPAAAAPAAAAPAADAPAAPAAAAPAAPAAAAPAADAAAPAATPAAAPAAAAPVDIKATLMHAAEAAKAGNYNVAVQDVMKTGLVEKVMASQNKPAADGSTPASGQSDLVSNLMHQAQGFMGGSKPAGTAGAAPAGGSDDLVSNLMHQAEGFMNKPAAGGASTGSSGGLGGLLSGLSDVKLGGDAPAAPKP